VLDGKTQSSYHYVLTQDFPYSVGCFRGTSQFKPGGMPSGSTSATGGVNTSTQTNNPPAPPQEAISACAGKSSGASCSVGPMSGSCATIGTYFACKPN
jgi:hypothetical protein